MVGKKGLTVAECEHPGWRGSHRLSVPNFSDELMFEKGQEYFWCQNTGVKTGGSLFFYFKEWQNQLFFAQLAKEGTINENIEDKYLIYGSQRVDKCALTAMHMRI